MFLSNNQILERSINFIFDFLFFILVLTAIFILILVSNEDYKDTIDAERLYKEKVCSGVWGDYKDINPTCDENPN